MLATSCKNEYDTNQSDSTTEKPIAVHDNDTRIMTYNFDVDMLNVKINEQFATRKEQERYIIESVRIIDNAPSNPAEFALIQTVHVPDNLLHG